MTKMDVIFIGAGAAALFGGVALLCSPFFSGHFIVPPSLALAIAVGGVGWVLTALATIGSGMTSDGSAISGSRTRVVDG